MCPGLISTLLLTLAGVATYLSSSSAFIRSLSSCSSCRYRQQHWSLCMYISLPQPLVPHAPSHILYTHKIGFGKYPQLPVPLPARKLFSDWLQMISDGDNPFILAGCTAIYIHTTMNSPNYQFSIFSHQSYMHPPALYAPTIL